MDRASGPGGLCVCVRVPCDLYLCVPAPSGGQLARPGDLSAHHWQGHTAGPARTERERGREGERDSGREGERDSGREGERGREREREGGREREGEGGREGERDRELEL